MNMNRARHPTAHPFSAGQLGLDLERHAPVVPATPPNAVVLQLAVVTGLTPEPFASRLIEASRPPRWRPGQLIIARFWFARTAGPHPLYLTRDGAWIAVEQPLPTSAWYERVAWPCDPADPEKAGREAAEACRRATGEYPVGWAEARNEGAPAAAGA